MSTIALEKEGPHVIMRMAKARANAIDGPLLQDMSAACGEIASDDAIKGVLLASAHPRVFCPGLDLRATFEMNRSELDRFIALFTDTIQALYGLEKPVVAAISGHAVAGGCVLALTADLRVLARGARMGLNEVRVGVPLPWTVALLLQACLPPEALTLVGLEGSNFADEQALQFGLAHEIAATEEFERACLERLSCLTDREGRAYGVTKRFLRHDTLQRMRDGEDARRAAFLDTWFTPSSQARIRAQVEALSG